VAPRKAHLRLMPDEAEGSSRRLASGTEHTMPTLDKNLAAVFVGRVIVGVSLVPRLARPWPQLRPASTMIDCRVIMSLSSDARNSTVRAMSPPRSTRWSD